MAYSLQMESFWRNAGIQLGKQWKIVAVVVVAITAVLAIGLTQVEFATGQDSYLNPDSQIAIDNVEFQDNFGGETVILLMSANPTVSTSPTSSAADNLATLESAHGRTRGGAERVSASSPRRCRSTSATRW